MDREESKILRKIFFLLNIKREKMFQFNTIVI